MPIDIPRAVIDRYVSHEIGVAEIAAETDLAAHQVRYLLSRAGLLRNRAAEKCSRLYRERSRPTPDPPSPERVTELFEQYESAKAAGAPIPQQQIAAELGIKQQNVSARYRRWKSDKQDRRHDEMTTRIADLESRLSQLGAELAVKDARIAELEQALLH